MAMAGPLPPTTAPLLATLYDRSEAGQPAQGLDRRPERPRSDRRSRGWIGS